MVSDLAIWRSKTREIRRQRELDDERIASTRLDVENQELQSLNEDRGKLISLVSHELRTPLTSVLAFTDILKKRQSGPNAEKNLELLSVMKQSGGQLLDIIEEMLDLSRLESTELSLDETEFDRGDEHPADARQRGDQIVGNTIGEILLLRVTAEIVESKHGDRGFVR